MSFSKVKIDKADRNFSWYVRLRDGKCLRCSTPVTLNDKGLPVSHQASHFQGRRKEATRFDEENVCTLCASCHGRFTENPYEHTAWQVKRLGQEAVDKIVLRSNTYMKKDRKLAEIYWKQRLVEDFNVKV
jgi:hypothetical protein